MKKMKRNTCSTRNVFVFPSLLLSGRIFLLVASWLCHKSGSICKIAVIFTCRFNFRFGIVFRGNSIGTRDGSRYEAM